MCVKIVSTWLSQQARGPFCLRIKQIFTLYVCTHINIATIAGRERKYLRLNAVLAEQTHDQQISPSTPVNTVIVNIIKRTVTRAYYLCSGFMRICHSTIQHATAMYVRSGGGGGVVVVWKEWGIIRRNRSSGVQTRRYTCPLINSQV